MASDPEINSTDSTGAAGGTPMLLLGLLSGLLVALLAWLVRRGRSEPVMPGWQPPHTADLPAGIQDLEARPAAAAPAVHGVYWPTPVRYLVGVGLFIFVLVLIYISRSVIAMLLFGALLAFILQPTASFLQRRLHFRRSLAVFSAHGLGFLVILLLPLIILPSIVNIAEMVMQIDFSRLPEWLLQTLEDLQVSLGSIPFIGAALTSLIDPMIESLTRMTTGAAPEQISLPIAFDAILEQVASTLGVVVQAAGIISSAFVAITFIIIISIYLSFDGYKLRGVLHRMLPPAYQPELEVLGEKLSLIWFSFLRGQLVLMLLIGVIVWLGAVALGLPEPVFFGFISGVLELIPNVGPLIAFIPAVVTALAFGSTHLPVSNLVFAIIIAIFYVLVQMIENQFIVPKILGDAVDLHPLVVLLGALIAGTQWGILGVLLATPMIASGREIFLYLYDKIRSTPPPPEPPPPAPSFLDNLQSQMKNLTSGARQRLNSLLGR